MSKYVPCLLARLNRLHLCDWSLGRLFGWRYGRWSKESQIESVFEKQAELFFNDSDELCGVVITENLGESYYILSGKDAGVFRAAVDFLLEGGNFNQSYMITVPMNDLLQIEILKENGFVYFSNADVTYRYSKEGIVLPDISIPDGFVLTSEKEYSDTTRAEKLRFFAFNPDGVYDEIIDFAYKYARNNPILIPELGILLLNERGEPVSTCTGLLDQKNRFMEVEVVATKKGYENRGLAKIVISECIRRGIVKGVKEFSISAWEEKTRRLYSSFGRPQILKKANYKREF